LSDVTIRVLLVEDSDSDAELVVRALKRGGYAPQHERVQNAADLRAALARQSWDIVLSDYYLPGFDALAALAALQEVAPDIPLIVVSGSVGEDTAVAAMQAGAADYVMKDRLQRLAPAVTRVVAAAAEHRDRRELERRLLQSQKMDAVGRLAGGVAHDFNNVLTAILGSVELLLTDERGAERREELDIIRDAATRAQDLIRQLLAFSSRQVLQPTVLDCNGLVKNLSKMLRRVIGEDIQLTTTLAPGLGPVRADAGQLEQVLVNLAVNARDAMPDGGRLAIATANADFDTAHAVPDHAPPLPPGHYVVLRVTDSGTGMDAQTQARMFEPFFTTKPQGKGTGLGLATVYGIVRQSGGHIDVDSALGRGTTFRIYLPRADGPFEEALAAPATSAPVVPGRETVLLAEDDPLVRLLARKVLEKAGYTVLVAASGADALTLAEGHAGAIDLLVTDVVMPEMSGRDLMRRLTQRHDGIKVLYVTGYADEAVAHHGVLDPGTAFLPKPFTPDRLTRKVREVLDEG
jgi:two-component system, cell cycle sensor histidine kinase and response regulator CckA